MTGWIIGAVAVIVFVAILMHGQLPAGTRPATPEPGSTLDNLRPLTAGGAGMAAGPTFNPTGVGAGVFITYDKV